MGKKRKSNSLPEAEMKSLETNKFDESNIEVNAKVIKKAKKNKSLKDAETTEEMLVSEIPQSEKKENSDTKSDSKKSKKKLKKGIIKSDISKSASVNENTINTVATKTRFIDDTPQEAANDAINQSTTSKKKKTKNPQQTEEDKDEVNDEDIDKFCDELTEEDNVQFENWVQLIEAKLYSKKNK